MTSSAPWRTALALAGITMTLGGPRHPNPHLDLSFEESTALMLADARWVPAHAMILVSYVLLFAGLLLWRRWADLPVGVERWARVTLVVLPFAMLEMAFHTASVVDLARLRAGEPTPILSAHLWLALIVNPVLTVAVAGLALGAGRLRRLGSSWTGWVAIGGVLYGVASVYVILTHDQRASPLFAIGALFLALWSVLVAVWPARRTADGGAAGSATDAAAVGARPGA